jgi:hypothetical protein
MAQKLPSTASIVKKNKQTHPGGDSKNYMAYKLPRRQTKVKSTNNIYRAAVSFGLTC